MIKVAPSLLAVIRLLNKWDGITGTAMKKNPNPKLKHQQKMGQCFGHQVVMNEAGTALLQFSLTYDLS